MRLVLFRTERNEPGGCQYRHEIHGPVVNLDTLKGSREVLIPSDGTELLLRCLEVTHVRVLLLERAFDVDVVARFAMPGAVRPDQPQQGLLGGDVIQRGIPRGEEAVEDLEDLAEFLSPGGLDEAVAGHRCR
jgi:hypothetical protein